MVPVRQRRRLILSTLLLAASLAPAATPLSAEKADALRTRFENRQKETRTWSAGFTQTLALKGLREPVVSEGQIRFRAPDALRIDFSKPAGEFALAVGDQLFLQKPGKPVAEKSLSKDSAGKPFLSLLGLLQGRPPENEESFEVAVSRDEDRYLIVLTRKTGASGRLPKKITNTVGAESMEVQETVVELPNGGTLTYTFRNPSRNSPLPNAAFTPPAGR